MARRSCLAHGAGEAGDESAANTHASTRNTEQTAVSQAAVALAESLVRSHAARATLVPTGRLRSSPTLTLNHRARPARGRGRAGLLERTMRAEHDSKHARRRHHLSEEPQRPPGLVAIAEGDLGDPAPPPLRPAWASTGELIVALCHQGLAGLPIVAQRPVPGGQLLIRLRSIAGGAIPQQTPPALGRDRPGHTSVGQPINREPTRIDLVLQPLRSEQERPTHPRACQIDYHTLTPAGGSEPLVRYMPWPTCRL